MSTGRASRPNRAADTLFRRLTGIEQAVAHQQGIALSADAPLLWIADSGNGSLRTLRLGGGDLATVNLPRRLHGPTGLSVAAGAVWIAETDAHGILRYDIASGELSDVTIGE